MATVKPFSEYIHKFFCDIYEATIQRVEAETSFFSSIHAFNLTFYLLQKHLDHKLLVCIVECQDKVISSGFYSECSGIAQGLLGGTTPEKLKLSPTSLEFYQTSLWTKLCGNKILHLGGGRMC